MEENNSIFLQGLSEGQVIKHHRIARGLRQLDLAALAHCEQRHVINIEKNRWIRPDISERILMALGLWEGIGDDR